MDPYAMDSELRRTKLELAEVIDEVVFAENEKTKAFERLRELEAHITMMSDVLENLLGYAATVEQSVIVPALGDLQTAMASRVVVAGARASALVSAERLTAATDQLNGNTRLRKIIDNMKQSQSSSTERALEAREKMLATASSSLSCNLEDAYVLCDALLASKQQLSVLLADTTNRLVQTQASQLQSAAIPDRTRYMEQQEEIEKLRVYAEQMKKERDVLFEQNNRQRPLEALQQQHLAEKASLQQRITALEDAQGKSQQDRQNVAQRLDTLQRALEQVNTEKQLLVEEVAALRRSNNGMLAAGGGRSTAIMEQSQTAHALRLDMDQLIRDHSSVVTQLEGQIAQLRSELHAARAASSQHSTSAAMLAQLQRNNDVLRKELSQLQQQVSGGTAGQSASAEEERLRVSRLERTIQQLNDELASEKQRVTTAEQHHALERTRIVASFDEERRRYQEEREECDALVLKMTNELEFLIRENTALKHRVRSSGGFVVSP